MRFRFNPSKDLNKYVFYLLHDANNKVQYAGVTKYLKVFDLDDAKHCKMFTHIFHSQDVIVEIVDVCTSQNHALNARANWQSKNPLPDINRYMALNGRNAVIVCDQTGMEFRTAADVIAYFGGTEPNLSKHLRRKTGHKTFKGHTFTRGAPLPTSAVPLHAQATPVAVPLHKPVTPTEQ